MFLVVGVEIYCKIRGAFVTEKNEITNVDNIQAIHSRLGLFFQVKQSDLICHLHEYFSGDLHFYLLYALFATLPEFLAWSQVSCFVRPMR